MASRLFLTMFMAFLDDVRELGPLEPLSAFCYENNMPSVRNSSNASLREPLKQLYKSMKIRCNLTESDINVATIIPSRNHVEGLVVEILIMINANNLKSLKLAKQFCLNSSKIVAVYFGIQRFSLS